MKTCQTCGIQCEDSIEICENCGRPTDGSLTPENLRRTNTDSSFEAYQKTIEEKIEQQRREIQEIHQKIEKAKNGQSAQEEENRKKDKKKQKEFDPWDRTEEFTESDIQENKLFAVLTYLLGPIGILIGLIVNRQSPYMQFHIYQSVKITIAISIIAIVAAITFWTVIIPIFCVIAAIVMFAIELSCVIWTLVGKSKECPILRLILK